MESKDDNTKTERFAVYVEPITREVIEKAADLDGRSLSSFFVYAALKYAREVRQNHGDIFD